MHFTIIQQYLGGFYGKWGEMEKLIYPKFQEREDTIETPERFVVRYTQAAYARIPMLIQAEWQYLVRTIQGVG